MTEIERIHEVLMADGKIGAADATIYAQHHIRVFEERAVRAERKLADAAAEIERLRAGGCARDQRLTQYCAELMDAVRAEREACAMIVSVEAERLRIESRKVNSSASHTLRMAAEGRTYALLMRASVLDGVAAAIRARGDNP